MPELTNVEVNAPNRWRLETPGTQGWSRTARPDDPNKYLLVSADCHANEPATLWKERLDAKYRDRLPRIEVDAKGVKWSIGADGLSKSRLHDEPMEGEDKYRSHAGATPELRLQDHAVDGVDAEIIFPNKGLMMFATNDAEFAMAQCKIFNDWAWETYGPYNDRLASVACIPTADIALAKAEILRVAKMGFRSLSLPCKPIWGPHDPRHPNYNWPMYDELWAVVQDVDLPVLFHVSTGRDPRAARRDGGAVINYVSHSLAPTIEPVASLCASGAVERFPGLKFAAIESGIGWVAWALEAMDEAYKKHHFWSFPKLKNLPSDAFRSNGYASFQEDASGLALAEPFNLTGNFLWANDYPHHEGSWPHSAQAIERTMSHLKDESRARILGLNAAKLFKLDVAKLESYRQIRQHAN